MSHTIRRSIMSASVPISKAISKIHMPFSHKLITGKDYYDIRDKIEIGDTLLTRTRGEFGNLFIPDFWSHAAMYIGGFGDFKESVMESTTKGSDDIDLVSFLLTKDYISILRPTFLTLGERVQAAGIMKTTEGAPYDWLFEYNRQVANKALYCFENVAWAYQQVKGFGIFTPREFMGMTTFTGSDFYNAKDKFKLIWENDDSRTNKRNRGRARD